MHETERDLRLFQELLDLSARQAGPFLKKSLQIPQKTLSARQLARHFQGLHTVAFATSTSKGTPQVAPVLALFYRAKFYIPTVKTALRTRHVMNQPVVSLTAYDGNDFAVIVHGNAVIIDPEIDEHAEEYRIVEELHRSYSPTGEAASDWGKGVYLRVDPFQYFSFAREPERYSEHAGRV
jgi:uncharacterized pyridoxamine 5'-phosphate oxidase family protein